MLQRGGAEEVTESNRKVLEKLRRLERLADSAATEGERTAAAAAKKRLVERLEKEGVHVAPELVAEVGGEFLDFREDPAGPTLSLNDSPTLDVSETSAKRPYDPKARTVVGGPAEVSDEALPPVQVFEPSDLDAAPHAPRKRPPGPIPGAEPTPIGVVPESIVIRAPAVELFEPQWIEEEEDITQAGPGGTRVARPVDPFEERTPPVRTPPLGVPVAEFHRPVVRAPRGASFVAPPPMNPPAPSGPPHRPPASEPDQTASVRWTWKKVALSAVAVVATLEVAAFFLEPEPPPQFNSPVPGRSYRAARVDRASKACLGGTSAACASIGASIADLGGGAQWAPRAERSACAGGDTSACARLGERFAIESERRRDEPKAAEGPGSVDLFLEVACALGASSCSEDG